MLSEKNVISDLDCELQVKPHNNIRYIQQGLWRYPGAHCPQHRTNCHLIFKQMSIAIEIIICGIEHASPNDKMLHCRIKWLFKKIKATYYTQRKILFTRVYKDWWFNKKQHIIFLQRKRQWNVTVYHDQWIKGVTAGGCGNAPYQGDLDK